MLNSMTVKQQNVDKGLGGISAQCRQTASSLNYKGSLAHCQDYKVLHRLTNDKFYPEHNVGLKRPPFT